MLSSLVHLSRRSGRRLAYGLLAVMVSVGLWAGSAVKTPAISIWDLLRGGVQIIQLSNISDEQEMQIGAQMNQSIMGGEFRAYQNQTVASYVNAIGQRLAQATERPGIRYTFQVVDDPQVNAFATMGGYVYVTTGLMRTADNEAQLAGVMGHEIGHITGRHLIEQMKNDAIISTAATAAGIDRDRVASIGIELALRRPRSRNDEYDADARGLRYMGNAGYAQSAMPVFMAKLQSQGSPPTFLSTHPAPADRVQRLKDGIEPGHANGAGLNNTVYQQFIRSQLGR